MAESTIRGFARSSRPDPRRDPFGAARGPAVEPGWQVAVPPDVPHPTARAPLGIGAGVAGLAIQATLAPGRGRRKSDR